MSQSISRLRHWSAYLLFQCIKVAQERTVVRWLSSKPRINPISAGTLQPKPRLASGSQLFNLINACSQAACNQAVGIALMPAKIAGIIVQAVVIAYNHLDWPSQGARTASRIKTIANGYNNIKMGVE